MHKTLTASDFEEVRSDIDYAISICDDLSMILGDLGVIINAMERKIEESYYYPEANRTTSSAQLARLTMVEKRMKVLRADWLTIERWALDLKSIASGKLDTHNLVEEMEEIAVQADDMKRDMRAILKNVRMVKDVVLITFEEVYSS